jgi:hypothetical protein
MNKTAWLISAGIIVSVSSTGEVTAQYTMQQTYCNPVNIDYTYAIYDSHQDISYRSGADPAVVDFRNEYFMFVTRSLGYWHSADLLNWTFIRPLRWYFQGSNAPAAHNYKDSVLYVMGHPSGSMSVLYTDDPVRGDWKAVPGILHQLQDPDLFIDDDGQAYVFWGSSNVYPIRARKLDKNLRFRPDDEIHELFNLDMENHGWERFGDDHADTVTGGYLEGPWMTRHNGTYYLQYGAPGTELNVYANGVYTSDSPLGPYTYAPNNPVSYKPGGFMNGAGHGSTVKGPEGQYWHFATIAISVNINWERRINMFPAYFDDDGLMHVNTSFGDYPHYAPAVPGKKGQFRGWMLLSYDRPVTASSSLDQFQPANVTDESSKTFWVAEENNDSQWLMIDLESPGEVFAIQVNYHDHQSDIYGRVPGMRHRYLIEGSPDGKQWIVLVDRSNSYRDVPNDYVELGNSELVRYIRFSNIEAPMQNLAISGLRVFGRGTGEKPERVENFRVNRHDDRRDATITWNGQGNARGYNIRWGIAPDKLYSSWMIYNADSHLMRSLTTRQSYYFAIEAFNENGISELSDIIRVE